MLLGASSELFAASTELQPVSNEQVPAIASMTKSCYYVKLHGGNFNDGKARFKVLNDSKIINKGEMSNDGSLAFLGCSKPDIFTTSNSSEYFNHNMANDLQLQISDMQVDNDYYVNTNIDIAANIKTELSVDRASFPFRIKEMKYDTNFKIQHPSAFKVTFSSLDDNGARHYVPHSSDPNSFGANLTVLSYVLDVTLPTSDSYDTLLTSTEQSVEKSYSFKGQDTLPSDNSNFVHYYVNVGMPRLGNDLIDKNNPNANTDNNCVYDYDPGTKQIFGYCMLPNVSTLTTVKVDVGSCKNGIEGLSREKSTNAVYCLHSTKQPTITGIGGVISGNYLNTCEISKYAEEDDHKIATFNCLYRDPNHHYSVNRYKVNFDGVKDLNLIEINHDIGSNTLVLGSMSNKDFFDDGHTFALIKDDTVNYADNSAFITLQFDDRNTVIYKKAGSGYNVVADSGIKSRRVGLVIFYKGDLFASEEGSNPEPVWTSAKYTHGDGYKLSLRFNGDLVIYDKEGMELCRNSECLGQ